MSRLDFTLSAGPTVASARTLAALGSPITYHYDPDFLELFRAAPRKTAEAFRTTNDIVLMQGEAIVGLEGAARSLVRPGMHVLNLVQGVFGKGMGYWLADFGAVLHELHELWREPGRGDEYFGTLVNAYLVRGGRAVGVRAGRAYVDVGTLNGYREAIQLLRARQAPAPAAT